MATAKVKALFDIVPGFRFDRDEDWSIYLPIEKQSYMRRKRAEFINLQDNIDSSERIFHLELSKNKDISDNEKANKIREFEQKKKEFRRKRNELAEILVPKFEGFKQEALEIKQDTIYQEQEELRKKRRLAREEDVIDAEQDSDDEYMPRARVEEKVKPEKKVVEQTPKPSSPKKVVDPLIEGLQSADVQLVTELRSLIEHYKCRDRILKAADCYRNSYRRLKALDAFSAAVATYKKENATKRRQVKKQK